MTGQPHRPSMLIVSHTYVVAEHRKKLEALATWFDLTCVTINARDLGPMYGLAANQFTGDLASGYTLIELPVVGKIGTLFIMPGLCSFIRGRAWDYVLVENEPWALLKWQALLASRFQSQVAHYGEFTWENVLRPGLKGWIHQCIYRYTALNLDFWIGGNEAAGRILRASGAEPQKVLVCPQLGVDMVSYAPCSDEDKEARRGHLDLAENAFVVGFAGRLVSEKGVKELVEAVAELNDKPLARPLVLMLVGAGPLKPMLMERASSCQWLKLPDAVPHQELPNLLQAMDLLVLGSHPVHTKTVCWEEQFGHILIEAMACGCVAAGSSSGAIPEVIDDDEMIFPVGDKLAICSLIERAMTDGPWFAAKRERQMLRVRECYTHEHVARKIATFLLSLDER